MKILSVLKESHQLGKKSVAVLVDPDKIEDPGQLTQLINLANENCVDYFFVGGSLITTANLSTIVSHIKKEVSIPVILFPGSSQNNRIEVLPTGYILINSGKPTSVAYISNTTPIPDDKYSLAACTALAGEMLGLQLIYLDAGSGAEKEISAKMVSTVRKAVDTPLIVGGGINSAQKAMTALEAGADMIVIGNALEKRPELLIEISEKVYDWNQSLSRK
jgi:heptaprenylglyceryl phosphate synthase